MLKLPPTSNWLELKGFRIIEKTLFSTFVAADVQVGLTMTNVDEKRRVVPVILETQSVDTPESVNAARNVGAWANDVQLMREIVENGVVGVVAGCTKYLMLLLI